MSEATSRENVEAMAKWLEWYAQDAPPEQFVQSAAMLLSLLARAEKAERERDEARRAMEVFAPAMPSIPEHAVGPYLEQRIQRVEEQATAAVYERAAEMVDHAAWKGAQDAVCKKLRNDLRALAAQERAKQEKQSSS